MGSFTIRSRSVFAYLLGFATSYLFRGTGMSSNYLTSVTKIENAQAPPAIKLSSKVDVDIITNGITQNDLLALTFWDKNSADLFDQIREEKEAGKRDKFFLPTTYKTRLNNAHYSDIHNTDGHQKEVYLMAREIMRQLVPPNEKKRTGFVADIGAGSGYKLVHYLSPEFKTIGFETEPAISFLRETYPDQEWFDSGKPEESMPTYDGNSFDLCICSDVIEHIRDPDALLAFLLSLECSVYVISTPKREVLAMEGPPGNTHHVREWTFHELQAYVADQGFHVVRAVDGLQHASTQFLVAVKAE
jgi:SAM-dependent methyltransferase